MPGVNDRPMFLVIEPFVEFETIDRAVNDRSGGIYRLSLAQYRDRELDRYSFVRWEADLRHYFSFVKDTRTIALRAWASSARPDSGQGGAVLSPADAGRGADASWIPHVPLSETAAPCCSRLSIAGASTSSSPARSFTIRAPSARTLDDLGRFERSYGFGLRAGNRMGSAFRLDFAFGGREGHRILVRFDDVF